MNEDPKWYPEYYYTWKNAQKMKQHHERNGRNTRGPVEHDDDYVKGKWKIEYQRMKPTERLSGIPKEYDK